MRLVDPAVHHGHRPSAAVHADGCRLVGLHERAALVEHGGETLVLEDPTHVEARRLELTQARRIHIEHDVGKGLVAMQELRTAGLQLRPEGGPGIGNVTSAGR